MPFMQIGRIPCVLNFMIWGSCVLVEVLLALMGGIFVYKARSEEEQEGSDSLNSDQVSIPPPLKPLLSHVVVVVVERRLLFLRLL